MARKRKGPNNYVIVNWFEGRYGEAGLEQWQLLCDDIGLVGNFTSITQCRKAIKKVYINIHDLRDAVLAGTTPQRFRGRNALADYTVKKRKVYPREEAKKAGPIKALLRDIL